MILTTEHIGRMIEYPFTDNRSKLLAVNKNEIWVEYNTHNYTHPNDGNWELVEPKKKPSEIIREKMSTTLVETSNYLSNSDKYLSVAISEILNFLDEHMGEKK